MKQPPPFRHRLHRIGNNRPTTPPPPVNTERRSGLDRRNPEEVLFIRNQALHFLDAVERTFQGNPRMFKTEAALLRALVDHLKDKTIPSQRDGVDRRKKVA